MKFDRKYNLLSLAEESAYSAKGHFKSADWVNYSVRFAIFFPLCISVYFLAFPSVGQLSTIAATLSLLFSVIALTSPLIRDSERAVKEIEGHMALGNEYLSVHKSIRNKLPLENVTEDEVSQFSLQVSELDKKTDKLPIGVMARWWVKYRIDDEMDLSWIVQGKCER